MIRKTHRLVGEWAVEITLRDETGRETKAIVDVPPPVSIKVRHEVYDGLPDFDPSAWGGWQKGAPLNGLKAQECTTCFALVPESLTVLSGEGGDAMVFERGRDYEAELNWGSVGRLPQGRIKPGQPVFISYEYYEQRLDSILLDAEGRIRFRGGVPHIATPHEPPLSEREIRLINIHVDRKMERLTEENLYPVLETAYPEPVRQTPSVAERFLPKTMKRIQDGGPLNILAWGDSVTEGAYLADRERGRWQSQFSERLRRRFPKAVINVRTEAWPGRNTSAYLAEPPGSVHNYQERVLALKPDLVIMEFVNDAELSGAAFKTQYERLLADIRGIGAEWLILTPHYIRGDWMGLTRQKEIDEDPRPYVKALRNFSVEHHVPLAEASLRYGRLWRQGIPYLTLMQNNINHPDARGMKLFADSLVELFP